MKVPYDEHYKKKRYFGSPYPGMIQFFSKEDRSGHVLDLGCGQGRDALYLASIGYRVTGVDISKVGIEQMLDQAKREGLDIRGIVADLYTFEIERCYDIVLLDSILHFYKMDQVREKELVQRIFGQLKEQAVLCVFMQSGKEREQILKEALRSTGLMFEVLSDTYTPYPEWDGLFHMYIVRKV